MENNEVLNETETGISISDLLLLVKKNIVMILLITFIFTLAGAVYGFKYKEITYTANGSAIILVGNTAGNNTNDYQNVLIAQYMLTTFKDYMSSGVVITDVLNSDSCKGYELDIPSVSNSLTISIKSTNSLVLSVSYKSTNKEQAIKVLNQILDSTYHLSNDGDLKLTLGDKFTILERASDFNTSASRGAALVICIAFAIGAMLSLGIVLVKYLLDDTYRSKEDFERQLNVSLIANLPMIREEKGGIK